MLRSLVAYTTGLTLDLCLLSRKRMRSGWSHQLNGDAPGGLLVGVSFEDDEAKFSPPFRSELSHVPWRTLLEAGGGERQHQVRLWIAPLPLTGRLHLGLRWSDCQIGELHTFLTCPGPEEVRARSVTLWP